MNPTLLQISSDDHHKLSLLLGHTPAAAFGLTHERLRDELKRALVLDPRALPADVVAMGKEVELLDLATGEVETYVLSYPEMANPAQGRLSVLAPIGTAIIGYRQGDEIHWPTPGGVRRIIIRAVRAARLASAPVLAGEVTGVPASA